MVWVALGIVAVAAAVGYWWYRRRRRHRLIAFVGLTREPFPLDPAVLARVAGRAWGADLGDGSAEGPDGFVVGMDIHATIMHDGRMFLINSFPRPYTDDVDKVADGITDLRIRSLFLEHKAWFSCDALGVDGSTTDDEVREWFRRLGKLFVELLDDNCLLIYVPDTQRSYPINEDTEAALRSDDPLTALQETLSLPVIEVSGDDPRMQAAVARAREGWAVFVAAYEQRAGESFNVKAPVTHGDNTEFIWIEVTSIEGDRVYGTLGNDPASLGPLKLGSKVSVLVEDLNDWLYIDRQGKMAGGFTIEVVTQAARRKS
jgi:uncharacterized protein YegJ (DUF2314 family)